MLYIFRASVVLCFLLPLVLADEVDIKMNSVKADKKKPGSFRFQGMCVYDMDDDVEAEGVTFSVQFDRPTQGFKVKFFLYILFEPSYEKRYLGVVRLEIF